MTDRAAIAVPRSATPGRRTPTFTSESVPAGLLSAHKTTVWAELIVTTGSVTFTDEIPPWETTVDPGKPVAIVPNRPHHITPHPGAEFHVQFYDTGTG